MLSMAPNIVFAPNIHRTQNTDTGRKTQTQLISALPKFGIRHYYNHRHHPLLILLFQTSGLKSWKKMRARAESENETSSTKSRLKRHVEKRVRPQHDLRALRLCLKYPK